MTKEIKNLRVSVYEKFFIKKGEREIHKVLNAIKTGVFKEEIERIRQIYLDEGKEAADKLKEKLLSVTFSARFGERRKKDSPINYNSIVVLDFDGLGEILELSKRVINKEPTTYASFVSPKGDGVKVLVIIDNHDPNKHSEASEQVAKYYECLINQKADSTHDLSRLCFVSDDPNLHLNENAKVFETKIESKEEPIEVNEPSSQYDNKFRVALLWVEKNTEFVEGNRNNFIFKLACNTNKFGIPLEEVYKLLPDNFWYNKPEVKRIFNSVYTSKKDEFNTKELQNKTVDKSQKEDKQYHPMKIAELMQKAAAMPKMEFLFRGIPTETSFGVIVGQSKSGKTIFSESMAWAITSGANEFMGEDIKIVHDKVLFVSLEEYYTHRMERNRKQMEGISKYAVANFEDRFMTSPENMPIQISTKEDWQALECLIKESHAKYVFVDSLTRLNNGNIEDSKTAQEVCQRLRDIAYRLGIVLMIIHHTTKQHGRPVTLDSIAGSRVISQEADFALAINRTAEGTRYLKDIFNRYKEDTQVVNVFEIDKNCILAKNIDFTTERELLKDDDGRVDDTNRDEILSLMKEQEQTKTSQFKKRLVESGIMKQITLQTNLKKLIEEGKIYRISKGVYKIK